MVQMEPSTTLTLKNLAPMGAVLTAEIQAALDNSLPIKRAETGLKHVVLWGRILTRSGKDYLIAEGYNSGYVRDGKTTFETRYFYSQDGVKWVDLPPVDGPTTERAKKIRTLLTGDTANQTTIEEADPNAADLPPAAEGEEGAGKLTFVITELQRLRVMVNSIAKATSVLPKGCKVLDAQNRLVTNKLWEGADYPDKLESYVHRNDLPDAKSLADDVRGTWSIQYDAFRGVANLRSLLYPGFFFYYDVRAATWGSLYVGDGVKNNDLVFML